MIHLRITVAGAPFFDSHFNEVEGLHRPLADLLEVCRQAKQACLILADYENVTRIVGRA